MIDVLFLTGLILAAVGLIRIVGGRVAWLVRRDRQVNAARQQVAHGALSDPDLMAIAYAVREDKRRAVRGNQKFTGRAVAKSRQSVRNLNAWFDERAAAEVLHEAEQICKESTR